MRTEAGEGLSQWWQEEKPIGITSHALYEVHVDIRNTSSRLKVLPPLTSVTQPTPLKHSLAKENSFFFTADMALMSRKWYAYYHAVWVMRFAILQRLIRKCVTNSEWKRSSRTAEWCQTPKTEGVTNTEVLRSVDEKCVTLGTKPCME